MTGTLYAAGETILIKADSISIEGFGGVIRLSEAGVTWSNGVAEIRLKDGVLNVGPSQDQARPPALPR